MSDNVKNICKSYNIITRCEFLDDDLFSIRLVEYYKNCISNFDDTEESKNKALKMDYVIRRYIEDYSFSKKLQSSIDIPSVLKASFNSYDTLIDYMLKFSEKYDNDKGVVIENTKWI